MNDNYSCEEENYDVVSQPKGGTTGKLNKKRNQWEMDQKLKMSDMFRNKDISYPECIRAAIDSDKQNHRMSRINHRILCFKNDGIYQLNKAISSVFGTVSSREDPNPSATPETVNMVDIKLADGTRCKAPYGDISLESLGPGSEININYDEDTCELIISGKCLQMYMGFMDDIFDETERLLNSESIYRSQALEVTDLNDPKVMDLSSIDNQLMILSDDVEYALRPIIARITEPKKCIERGVPLKYGALLEGPYGTGKSLLAFKLARMATKNNWAFIYLKDPSLLADTLRLSRVIDHSGNGVIVFVEDIDQVTRGDRDIAMQDILNTLDGGDTKDMNVISLFTTNHLNIIEPTFLRGKRIGTVIPMGFLDEKTTRRFIEESFKIGNYKIVDDITGICKLVADSFIAPAFMAEIVEAVKARLVIDDSRKVTEKDLRYAVNGYLRQVELSRTKDLDESPEQHLAQSLRKVLHIDEIEAKLDDLVSTLI